MFSITTPDKSKNALSKEEICENCFSGIKLPLSHIVANEELMREALEKGEHRYPDGFMFGGELMNEFGKVVYTGDQARVFIKLVENEFPELAQQLRDDLGYRESNGVVVVSAYPTTRIPKNWCGLCSEDMIHGFKQQAAIQA